MTDKKELKLIAFDLDGTFLNDSKEIPEENLQAIEEAAKRDDGSCKGKLRWALYLCQSYQLCNN